MLTALSMMKDSWRPYTLMNYIGVTTELSLLESLLGMLGLCCRGRDSRPAQLFDAAKPISLKMFASSPVKKPLGVELYKFC